MIRDTRILSRSLAGPDIIPTPPFAETNRRYRWRLAAYRRHPPSFPKPALRYSTTSLLRHFATPPPRYSATPLLRHFDTPSLATGSTSGWRLARSEAGECFQLPELIRGTDDNQRVASLE